MTVDVVIKSWLHINPHIRGGCRILERRGSNLCVGAPA